MGFTNTCGVQVVDVGGYEPFVWRCDWRVARFASRTDTFAKTPLLFVVVGRACSTRLCLLWLVDPITLFAMKLSLAVVYS